MYIYNSVFNQVILQSRHAFIDLNITSQCNAGDIINPWSTELYNLNFQSLKVVSRYRDPQLEVTEN